MKVENVYLHCDPAMALGSSGGRRAVQRRNERRLTQRKNEGWFNRGPCIDADVCGNCIAKPVLHTRYDARGFGDAMRGAFGH